MSLRDLERSLKIPKDLKYPKAMESYFNELISKVREIYLLASDAKKIGVDPKPYPEIKLASDLASRVEALVGPPGISKRIRELLKKNLEIEEISFIVAREIAEGQFGISDKEARASQAIKTAMAVLAGITAAPIEGVTHVKIRADGHLAVYYAGPIRSAGGTEAALTVIIADIIRKALNLPKYEISQRELERFVEEVFLYDRYMNLQYTPDRDKLIYVLKNLPIEITGEGTIDVEVSGQYKNMPNIETNKVRGGAVLVLNDGVILKAKKLLKIVKKANIEGWDWLSNIAGEKKETKGNEKVVKPNKKYLSDVIAGRPVLSSPSAIGGFRLRYGRSRNTGLAGLGVHPAIMVLTDNFLSIGIQIKTERPGKGAVITPVDSIMPPLVRLKNGTVKFVSDLEEAQKISKDVEKILFLGDLLVAIGEFLENNHIILPSPITEEWWEKELKKVVKEKGWTEKDFSLEDLIKKAGEDAHFSIELCKKLGIMMHPRFTYFWRNINLNELKTLKEAIMKTEANWLMNSKKIKDILEKLYLPHTVDKDRLILDKQDYEALKIILGSIDIREADGSEDALSYLNKNGWYIEDKYPVFIGARIGRPEKAKPRKMKPPVNVLFPMGDVGSKSRSIVKASKKRSETEIEAVFKKCPTCNISTYLNKCPKCGRRTVQAYKCERCGYETLQKTDRCPKCGGAMVAYKKYKVNLALLLKEATANLQIPSPKEVKGVKGLTSANKTPEILEKGVLRGRHSLYVFKDGTIRFDATDCPLTHFKPKEIGVSVEKLRELGYTHDIFGKPLENDDQVLELKVQDIIVSEEAADYLLRIGWFVDELLERVYNQEPYYNFSNVEDIIGHLVVGLAPHTSAGIIGRIIGFTKARCIYAHPYWHAAKRRNCDGDEDAIILLLDALLNFSVDFLPRTRGGFMDAPLVVTVLLNPLEVDSEVFNMDVNWEIPLEFYHKSKELPSPSEIEHLVENIDKRLNTEKQYYDFGYTHETSDINAGNTITVYKSLKTMKEKVIKQFSVMKKINAVEIESIADKILEVHLMPDVLGNMRSFGTQQFRCVDCNAKYRRPLLGNRCPRCGGRLMQTVFRKTILKYVPFIENIIKEYGVTQYMKNRFKIIKLTDIKIIEENAPMLEKFVNEKKGRKKEATYPSIKGVGKGKKISLDDLL
ncbi:MAG: DNA polymerase II large subunit [Candidatus Njordarchaeia archaeon]